MPGARGGSAWRGRCVVLAVSKMSAGGAAGGGRFRLGFRSGFRAFGRVRTRSCGSGGVAGLGKKPDSSWYESGVLLWAGLSMSVDPLQSAIEAFARVAGEVGELAPQALRYVVPWGLAAVGAVLLVSVVVVAGRATAERAQLRGRVAVTMLPTESFDPSMASVMRLSAQLARVRPAVSLSPRHASALRLTVRTGPDGRVVHQVSGPARAASVLRSAVYPQVELMAADVDESVPSLSVPPAEVVGVVSEGAGSGAGGEAA